MERASAKVPCPDCGIASEASDPGLTRWHCTRCGHLYFLRRCSVCGLVSHVSGLHGWHQPWECVWCKATNTGFTQNNDPAEATVGELADDVARHNLAFAPPGHLADPDPRSSVLLASGPAAPDGDPAPDDVPVARGVPAACIPGGSAGPGPGDEGLAGSGCAAGPGPEGAGMAGPGCAAGPGPGCAVTPGPGDDAVPMPGRFPLASRPRHPWRDRAFAGLTVAVIVALAVLIALANRGAPGIGSVPAGHQAAGAVPAGHGAPAKAQPASGRTRAVSVSAEAVGAVDLQALPGLLTIVGTRTDRVTLTGELRWKGRAPAVAGRLDRATRVLSLSYRCAPASPCSGNYRLSVPDNTATALLLPSGRLVLSGVGGPVMITAASVNVTATGLHTPALAVAITSGRLTASFSLPPRRISIMLTLAQATLRLPASAAYRVSQHVTSGSVNVAVPHAGTAANTVTAFLRASNLTLLSGT